MQQTEKKYYGSPQEGMMDSDSAPFSVPSNAWVNSENIRSGTTDKGVTETIESIGNTTLISQPQPSINFIDLGAADDIPNNRFCKFKFNITGRDDKIVCYDGNTGIEYDVLLSSQVIGGFNFSKYSPIHSARVINGLLYWVDSTNNQPRKINIDAAILANNPSFVPYQQNVVAYTFPINFSEITIIKPTEITPPIIFKGNDSTIATNFIYNQSFEFCYQFIYYDNEITVVSAYSIASKLNSIVDNYNMVNVVMDFFEIIPQTVRIVNLIVRIQDGTPTGGNNANIIKVWDREVAAENIEIENQNNSISQLTYFFYNNSTGETIEEIDVLRPFDNVPIYSEALETAKDRIFLGDNTEGYDTPSTTSLQASVIITDINSYQLIQVRWCHTQAKPFDINNYGAWYVIYNGQYYEITATVIRQFTLTVPAYPTLGSPPTEVGFSGLTLKGSNQSAVLTNSGYYAVGTSPNMYEFVPTTNNVIIDNVNSVPQQFFLPTSSLIAGNIFFDYAKRACGVITNSGLVINIPQRDFNYTSGASNINWSLSNDNAINEIPVWAYYVSPLLTLNQKTRFFIESVAIAPVYATKDVNGNYVLTATSYTIDTVGIGLDTNALFQAGLGYAFTNGDQCTIILSDNTFYTLPVIAQSGNYIIIKAKDIGTLSGATLIYNIYTPYQTSVQEPYYQVGQLYRILNPGTDERAYSDLSGIFLPDIYVLARMYNSTSYLASAMSPNDLYYQRWDNNNAMAFFITKLGQVVKTQYTSWSDEFLPNTSVNGLSTFRVGNEIPVPQNCGAIQKLILTSKVSDLKEGNILLCICTKETSSMYLGETQISDAEGNPQFLGTNINVIGTINTLKGSSGTINPESVTEYRGRVWWFDAISGRYTQYSENGLFFISNYKMVRFWKNWALQYNSMTKQEIEALGSRPFVFSIVDPAHDELLISIPKLSNTPPKGYLPDYYPARNAIAVINVSMLDAGGIYITTCADPILGGMTIGTYTQTDSDTYDTLIKYIVNNINTLGTGYTASANTNGYNIIAKADLNDTINGNPAVLTAIGTPGTYTYPTTFSGGADGIGDRAIIYPFDILDFAAKTIVFKLEQAGMPPHWQGAYRMTPEMFITLNNKLYTGKNGLTYLHNQTNGVPNTFYGVTYPSKIMGISNANVMIPKVYNNIEVQANIRPNFVYLYCKDPIQQSSDLVDYDFRPYEGIFKSPIYRNKLVPTENGYTVDGLLTAEKMRNVALFIMIQFNPIDTPLEFKFLEICYDISRGQQ